MTGAMLVRYLDERREQVVQKEDRVLARSLQHLQQAV